MSDEMHDGALLSDGKRKPVGVASLIVCNTDGPPVGVIPSIWSACADLPAEFRSVSLALERVLNASLG